MKSFPTALFSWSFGAHLTDWAINPIERAHVAPCHVQGARAHEALCSHLHGYEYDPPDHPCVYGDEHVHEDARGRVSGCARGNERDLRACVHGYVCENVDANEDAHVREVLPYATS